MIRITQSIDGLALVSAGQGQPERALRLAGASAHLRPGANEQTLPPDKVAELQKGLKPARAALGELAATTVWNEGQAMTLEQAISYALEPDQA